MRSCPLAANRAFITGVAFLALSFMPLTEFLMAQTPVTPSSSALRGTVHDSRGRAVAAVTVHLELQGESKHLLTHTDSQGKYRFAALSPGRYMLRAEMAGYGSASFGPIALTPGATRNVDLSLPPPSSQSPAASLPYFDEPQFTIAGVTDPTVLGGHGSNVTAPAREDLAREVTTLGKTAPISSPAAQTENALRAAADRQPASFDANHRLGRFLLDRDKPREALPYLERATRLEPGDYQSSYDLALAYANAGKYEPAQSTLRALLAAHDRPELYHLLAGIEEQRGDSLNAEKHYERAAQLEPSEANLFDWGAQLLLHRAPEPAIEVFNKGNRLFPRSVRMLLGLGASWFVRGSADQAARYLCQASDLDPADSRPYLFLGQIGETEAAPSAGVVERMARFARLRPQEAPANYYYALSLWKQDQRSGTADHRDQVQSLLQKAERLDPHFAPACLQLGILYSEQKQYAAAIPLFQKAIAADPGLAEAHYRLGQAYMRTSQQTKARAELLIYDQMVRENAQRSARQQRHLQQFVYTLRNATPSQMR